MGEETQSEFGSAETVNKNEQAQHDNILPVGSHVMFITPPEKRWHPAIIQEYLGYWSYKV